MQAFHARPSTAGVRRRIMATRAGLLADGVELPRPDTAQAACLEATVAELIRAHDTAWIRWVMAAVPAAVVIHAVNQTVVARNRMVIRNPGAWWSVRVARLFEHLRDRIRSVRPGQNGTRFVLSGRRIQCGPPSWGL